MKTINNKSLLILFLGIIGIYQVGKSQRVQLTGSEYNELKKVTGAYLSYYIVANTTDPLPVAQFNDLFLNKEIKIPRDFPAPKWVDSTYPLNAYHLNFNAFIIDSTVETIDYTDPAEVIYAIIGDAWYAWIQKSIKFEPETGQKPYTTVTRLKIIRSKYNSFKISEIKLFRFLPKDLDHDFIADEIEEGSVCDICTTKLKTDKTNFIALNGCFNDDLDGDGITNDKDSCIDVRGVKSNHGCPNPPSSRFGFSISGGILFPLFTEFSNQDRVSSSGWERNGYYAKNGFLIDAAFNFNMSRWAGIKLGSLYTNKPLDASHLENQIRYYMGTTGTIPKSVTVSSMSYQILIPYFSVQLGNLKSTKNIVTFEPLVGVAFTDLGFFKNNFKVNIQYQDSTTADGEAIQNTSNITFKTSPFLVYGGKVNYAYRLDSENRARLVATVSYLSGDYEFTNQAVTIGSTTSELTFAGSKFQFLGVSLGLYFNLGIPKQFKKWY